LNYRKSVDLPEPDGPISAVKWPGRTSKLIPRRTSGPAAYA